MTDPQLAMRAVRRRLPLHTRMLIGFAIGIVAGLVAHRFLAGDPRLVWFLSHVSQPVGKVFLRLLFKSGCKADDHGIFGGQFAQGVDAQPCVLSF